MDSNTHSIEAPTEHSTGHPIRQSAGLPDGLAALAAAVDELAAQDLDGLPDHLRAQRVLGLRRLLDRLQGQRLYELASLDARGAAGADQGIQTGSTASWLAPASGWAPAPPPVPCAPPGPSPKAP